MPSESQPPTTDEDHVLLDGSRGGSLGDRLLDALRDDVITGRYPPGYRLVERDVAATYGVSRLPAREALQSLRGEGFVEVRKTRGLVVRSWTRRDVTELFDIRVALESMACREAADKRSDDDVTALRTAITAADAAFGSGDLRAAHDANAQFHRLLVTSSHNDTLVQVMSPILSRVQWLVRQIPDPHAVISDHAELAEAIADGDGARAEARARTHAEHNREVTLSAMFDDR
ncbi:GntR family transcriptional regulator [Williamsia sterculiae]|uniref:DNA-binding transcriptional regulator, GntR family n=1 Tax=Williamsia sterculiae TaxID=1344003 RepID=A0A1N7GI54_9NOCA|nr:GntR family transcriptional regulator [Williamsia sterculiae]SIS12275.1 DNA-binding transcriptional regulator, GntR family [Williamsia sterculiae]